MYPKQGEWGNGVCAVLGQKVPTFPRDGRGEPRMQPSRDLHIVVSHRALRKGLRRALQQAHLKGEASLPRGWDVALFLCCFLICSLICTVCPCTRAFGGITATPRARSLIRWGLPGRTVPRRCLIVEWWVSYPILKFVPQRNLNTKARLIKEAKETICPKLASSIPSS